MLTKTERKIAHGISQGYIEKELADKFCVSVHTIHAHTRNIRKKLNVRNIADITRVYILSLERPKDVLKALFFVAIQVGIMVSDFIPDLRIPVNGASKTVRTARRVKLKTDYYV